MDTKETKEDRMQDGKTPVSAHTTGIECMICLHPILDRIYQCENGHLICIECKSELWFMQESEEFNCPTCNCGTRFISRCTQLERLADNMSFPCPFSCKDMKKKVLPRPAMHQHVATECKAQTFRCMLFIDESVTVRRCSFHGNAQELAAHLHHAHAMQLKQEVNDVKALRFRGDFPQLATLALGKSMTYVNSFQHPTQANIFCFMILTMNVTSGLRLTIGCISRASQPPVRLMFQHADVEFSIKVPVLPYAFYENDVTVILSNTCTRYMIEKSHHFQIDISSATNEQESSHNSQQPKKKKRKTRS